MVLDGATIERKDIDEMYDALHKVLRTLAKYTSTSNITEEVGESATEDDGGGVEEMTKARRKRGYLEREKMNLLDGAAGMSRAKRWQRK